MAAVDPTYQITFKNIFRSVSISFFDLISFIHYRSVRYMTGFEACKVFFIIILNLCLSFSSSKNPNGYVGLEVKNMATKPSVAGSNPRHC